MLIAGSLLAACNFTPAYGPTETGTQLQNRIFIPEPQTEDLYEVVKHFEQRMGRAQQDLADLHLSISVSKSFASQGWTATGVSTRGSWTGYMTYTLTDPQTDETLATNSLTRFASYATTTNTVSTLTSERDAARRVMIMLTDAMIDQLLQIDPATLP